MNTDKESLPQDQGSNAIIDINADENVNGSPGLNEAMDAGGEIEKIKGELDGLKDKYLRLVAEYDNYRKRTAKERMELIQTAGKDAIIPLLEVLDDSERAEKQMQLGDDVNKIKEGVQLVFNKLRKTLSAKGVKPMQAAGTPFDPDKHEAITEITAPSDEMKGKVIDEIEKGYYLNDKIIRFAKVVVGK